MWWWVHEHPWLFVLLIFGVLGMLGAAMVKAASRVVGLIPMVSMACRQGQHGNCLRGCQCPCHDRRRVNQSSGDDAQA